MTQPKFGPAKAAPTLPYLAKVVETKDEKYIFKQGIGSNSLKKCNSLKINNVLFLAE